MAAVASQKELRAQRGIEALETVAMTCTPQNRSTAMIALSAMQSMIHALPENSTAKRDLQERWEICQESIDPKAADSRMLEAMSQAFQSMSTESP